MLVVASYRSLSVKRGYVLRAYQYRAGGNGNGIVWALPVGAAFPEPEECDSLEDRFLEPPRPRDALTDFMEVIEGTGRARAYFSASLLKRGLQELGAMWHGCGWSDHRILFATPVEQGDAEAWSWDEPPPDDWPPEVRPVGSGVALDPAAWHTWWELHKDPYLQLKEAIYKDPTSTGSDDFFLGHGEQPTLEELRPPQAVIEAEVVPALLAVMTTDEMPSVISSATMALAKIGADSCGERAGDVEAALRALLDAGNQEVVEAAALALGLCRRRPLH